MRHSDVVIVGAGIIGAACAYALAEAGLSVTVLEATAAASGTSSQGEGNLLLSDKEPGPELLLARSSLRLWETADARLREHLPAAFPSIEYERKGGLVVATTDAGAETLVEFAQHQVAAGIAAAVVDHDAALDLEPDLNPAVTAAVHYPDDAQVQPVIATEALLAAARRLGAQTVVDARVIGPLGEHGSKITGVRTETTSYHAPLVLLSCGPWSGEVARTLGTTLPVRPRRGVVLVTTRMPHRIVHKVYDADYVGAVSSDDRGLQTSSVIESTAAGTVLIGSSRRQAGFDDTLDLEAVRQIAAKAMHVFPFLADAAVMRVYGGFRPYLPDHLPAIGPDPRVDGLWHASGHEGAGIGLAPGTAQLITELITGAEPSLDPAPYDPGRPALRRAVTS
jgi:glycine/D-amino acid oxidase-like deaminating enzyme